MLAAAVVPHPPLLVPAIAAGAAASVAPLLAACDAAAADLVAELPEAVVCVGSGTRTRRHPAGSWGTLAGFGVQVEAPTHHRRGLPHLPLSLTIGRWLLDRVAWDGPVALQEVAQDATGSECVALGRSLAGEYGPRSTWLVLGDASSCTEPGTAGPDDQQARAFDASVSAALAAGDVTALAHLDVRAAAQVGATGRAAWRVLAAAADTDRPNAAELGRVTEPPHATPGARRAMLRYDDAPYGVRYLVASWWVR